jgi:hypothetical protein
MMEPWLLDRIQRTCSVAGFPQPLPTYKSLYEQAKRAGEQTLDVGNMLFAEQWNVACSTCYVDGCTDANTQSYVCSLCVRLP